MAVHIAEQEGVRGRGVAGRHQADAAHRQLRTDCAAGLRRVGSIFVAQHERRDGVDDTIQCSMAVHTDKVVVEQREIVVAVPVVEQHTALAIFRKAGVAVHNILAVVPDSPVASESSSGTGFSYVTE